MGDQDPERIIKALKLLGFVFSKGSKDVYVGWGSVWAGGFTGYKLHATLVYDKSSGKTLISIRSSSTWINFSDKDPKKLEDILQSTLE